MVYADTISQVCVQENDTVGSPGGQKPLFAKIDDDKFANERPYVAYGDLNPTKSKDKIQGTIWSMPENPDSYGRDKLIQGGSLDGMLNADEAMRCMTAPIKTKSEGWGTNNKGFCVEWFGWYGSENWYCKWNWEIYNSSNYRNSLPIKGLVFQYRIPDESGLVAINSARYKEDPYSQDDRGDQTAIINMWGLWFHRPSGKYYVFELKVWGSDHAPSKDPTLKSEKSVFYSPYWFSKLDQYEKGAVVSSDRKCDGADIRGEKVPIMVWCNEKIIEECSFCGFAVQNSTEKKAAAPHSHTNQIGMLSPIPFHIDRITDNARVVFGGPAGGSDYPIRSW